MCCTMAGARGLGEARELPPLFELQECKGVGVTCEEPGGGSEA